MNVEGFKQIAAYIALRTGISVTENAARKWAMRAGDPLPVERFAGRVFVRGADLDAWMMRQKGRHRRRPPRETRLDT